MFEVGKQVYVVMGLQYLSNKLKAEGLSIQTIEKFIYPNYIAGICIDSHNKISYQICKEDLKEVDVEDQEVIGWVDERDVFKDYISAFYEVYRMIRLDLENEKKELIAKTVKLEELKQMVEQSMFTNPTHSKYN